MATADRELPEKFEEYILLRLLGQGAMGRVYLAQDTLLDRSVAVKFTQVGRGGRLARERFLLEARALARLQHPNVVTVFRVGESAGQPFIVSEYVRGETLASLPLPLPWSQALSLGVGLARGLAAAHRQGVLHRDVKPANAVLSEDGSVKLLDFGLAKVLGAERAEGLEPVFTAGPPTVGPSLGPSQSPPARSDAAGPPLADTLDSPASPLAAAPRPRQELAARTPEVTRDGAVMGTPRYMAPEAWRGEAATARTDVYALGAVLYELCSGAAPFAHLTVSELAARVQTENAAPLETRVPGVDAGLARVVAQCLERDPGLRYASAEALREALERLTFSRHAQAPPDGNPYRGLRAFDREHGALFFGRAGEVGGVLERLREGRWALVTADSGVGKSSLCRAGLLPAIQEGALWTPPPDCVTWIPGARPLASLAEALAHRLGVDAEVLETQLRVAPEEVARALWRPAQGLVLFVDQMEELLTLAPGAQAEATARALRALVPEGLGRVRLVGAVRSDHFASVAALPGLAEVASRGLYVLQPLPLEGLREAVMGPARVKGFGFESPELVETLSHAGLAGEGALPLLQFALAELWDRRDLRRRLLTRAALAELGGVEGCLAQHADAVLKALLPAQRDAARNILLALVTPEGTRVRRTESELLRLAPEGPAALEALVRGRLLAVGSGSPGTGGTFEVAHEALLLHWKALHDWLAEGSEQRLIRARLERATAEWARMGRATEGLLGQRALAEARVLPSERVGLPERQLMEASARALRRAFWRRWALRLALPTTLVVAALPIAKSRYDRAQTVRVLRRESHSALEAAQRLETQASQARRAAFAEFDAGRDGAGEEAWARALQDGRAADAAYARAEGPLEGQLRAGGGPEVRGELADVALGRMRLSEAQRDVAGRDAALLRLSRWDVDGRRRQALSAPASLDIRVRPVGARVRIAPVGLVGGRYVEQPATPLPAGGATLPPGLFMVEAEAKGHVMVRSPVLLKAGEALRVDLTLPAQGVVPAGFVYVSPGRFLYGSAEDEGLRHFFLNAQPLHPARTAGFFIAVHEVTFAEWIEYLRALSPPERLRRLPDSGWHFHHLALEANARGRFSLALGISGQHYRAAENAPLHYPGRTLRATQDWTRFPVSAVSFEDAQAYARWLASTGRVPGARLCTDYEWERAARGADARSFPAEEMLAADDANHDVTYGRRPDAFGPDEVGSHPGSRSPFGVDDLAGNVWELVRAEHDARQPVMRGGCWYQHDVDARVSNREPTEPSDRDPLVGMRLCATPPLNLRGP